MKRLQRAYSEESARGRRRIWTRVGQRGDVRVVERELMRRIRELEWERSRYYDELDVLWRSAAAEASAADTPGDDGEAADPDQRDRERESINQHKPVGDAA